MNDHTQERVWCKVYHVKKEQRKEREAFLMVKQRVFVSLGFPTVEATQIRYECGGSELLEPEGRED